MNSWNGLDFFIFLILVLNTIRGMSRGAAKELIALMCLSAALIFSIKFTIPLANFMSSSPTISSVLNSKYIIRFFEALGAGPLTYGFVYQITYTISLMICFVSVFSITEAALLYSGVSESLSLSQALISRKLGGAIGFTRGYVLSVLLLSVIMLHLFRGDNHMPGSNMVSGSFFTELFSSQIILMDNLISSQRPDDYQEIYKQQPVDEKDIIERLQAPAKAKEDKLSSY